MCSFHSGMHRKMWGHTDHTACKAFWGHAPPSKDFRINRINMYRPRTLMIIKLETCLVSFFLRLFFVFVFVVVVIVVVVGSLLFFLFFLICHPCQVHALANMLLHGLLAIIMAVAKIIISHFWIL